MDTCHVYSSTGPRFLSLPTIPRRNIDRDRDMSFAETESGLVLTDEFDMSVFDEERGF